MSLAKATVTGILASDPEKRFTPNNHAVTTFNITVENPPFGKQTAPTFFQVRITCWRGLAESAEQMLKKGDVVLIDGKLIINSYQTPEGVQKRNYEVEANTLHKLSGSPQAIQPAVGTPAAVQPVSVQAGSVPAQQATVAAAPAQSPAQAPAGNYDFLSDTTEDDIPF
ncbi:MAG: single-stranded DNA-binding protein [Candidatus Melainabacteria bacterium]